VSDRAWDLWVIEQYEAKGRRYVRLATRWDSVLTSACWMAENLSGASFRVGKLARSYQGYEWYAVELPHKGFKP